MSIPDDAVAALARRTLRALAEASGHERAEPSGQPDALPGVDEQDRALVEQLPAVVFMAFMDRSRIIARDGRAVWFQCDASIVRHAGGRPWFTTSLAFDVTDRKLAEQALQQAGEELERKVRDATAALAEARPAAADRGTHGARGVASGATPSRASSLRPRPADSVSCPRPDARVT